MIILKSEATTLHEILSWHRSHYPLMNAEDVVKLFFQGTLGCGHLLADEAKVADRIMQEEQHLQPDAAMSLTEDLPGPYVRLYLPRAMADGIAPLWIARLMALSSAPDATRVDVMEALSTLSESESGCKASALAEAAARLEDPHYLPSHSDAYRDAYAPAYRVISRDVALLLPALQAIAAKMRQQSRVLVAIDGPCASGKTTCASKLSAVLGNVPIVHMDDFYTPHAQKTAERLAQPGGNADIERFCAEVLTPLQQDGHALYRPYSCRFDRLMDPIEVPDAQVCIIEGAYSLHPQTGRPYDVTLFLSAAPSLQKERILRRNGEAGWISFRDRWIPLEQQYFDAFHLPDERCIVLITDTGSAEA